MNREALVKVPIGSALRVGGGSFMFQKYIYIREKATFIKPYICIIRAFFIDLEHPAGGNGPSGAGFAAIRRHGTTE